MNLVSADTQKLMDFVVYFNAVWVAPIEIALCLFFLWQVRTDASTVEIKMDRIYVHVYSSSKICWTVTLSEKTPKKKTLYLI